MMTIDDRGIDTLVSDESASEDGPETAIVSVDRQALLVQLKIKEPSSLNAEKYARRCAEARALFKELFLLVEGRAMGRTGVLAHGDPSIVSLESADVVAIGEWAHKYSSLIHNIIRIDAPNHVSQDMPPAAPKKKPKDSFVPKVLDYALMLDNDDDGPPAHQDDED